jgi:hypothetical protein
MTQERCGCQVDRIVSDYQADWLAGRVATCLLRRGTPFCGRGDAMIASATAAT